MQGNSVYFRGVFYSQSCYLVASQISGIRGKTQECAVLRRIVNFASRALWPRQIYNLDDGRWSEMVRHVSEAVRTERQVRPAWSYMGPELKLCHLCRVFEYNNVFERSQNVNVNGSAKFDGAIFIK